MDNGSWLVMCRPCRSHLAPSCAKLWSKILSSLEIQAQCQVTKVDITKCYWLIVNHIKNLLQRKQETSTRDSDSEKKNTHWKKKEEKMQPKKI